MFIYPNINPIALSIGPIKIYWYGILYLISFAVIWLLAVKRSKYLYPKWTREQIIDLVFYGAVGVVVGGRVGEMLFYEYSTLFSQPLSLFAIWHGGMSFHGGLIGVLVSLYVFARKTQRNFWDIMDFVAPLVPLGLFFGRIGNFINHELWGRVTNVAWAIIYPMVDLSPRHPSQLYEACGEGILLFIILWLYSRRPKPRGAVAMIFLLGYGWIRFICEYFREPDVALAFNFLTRGQLFSLPMILMGAVGWFLVYKYHYLGEKNERNN